ncbi:MAG: TraR/DksA C4-type zinc finger protein [Ilumatobacteraceae bacterium]
MDAGAAREMGAAIAAERARTVEQIASLERAVASIVDAAELTSTDDEHDPEGTTIAYERAQASALLRQARIDLGHLDAAAARLAAGNVVLCADCGREIPLERVLALPSARRCVACAS